MFFWCLLCFLVDVMFKHLFCKPRNPELPQYCKWKNYSPIYPHCWLRVTVIGWRNKKGCTYVCACKNNFLLKCREVIKGHTSIALIQGWQPLRWKRVMLMSPFRAQKSRLGHVVWRLLQFVQNLEINVCICMCIYIFI